MRAFGYGYCQILTINARPYKNSVKGVDFKRIGYTSADVTVHRRSLGNGTDRHGKTLYFERIQFYRQTKT